MDIYLLRYRDSQIGLRHKETAYFIYEGCTQNAVGEKWGGNRGKEKKGEKWGKDETKGTRDKC